MVQSRPSFDTPSSLVARATQEPGVGDVPRLLGIRENRAWMGSPQGIRGVRRVVHQDLRPRDDREMNGDGGGFRIAGPVFFEGGQVS